MFADVIMIGMSKSIISFLTFLVLVLVVFVSSSIFSNLGRVDVLPVADNSTSTVATTTSSPNNNIVNTPTKEPVSNTGITMSDVQKHNNQSSCWTVVNGGVYDLTSFVSPHPGGSRAILSLCGIDGTSAFMDQHGNQRRPNNELVGLKIGNLAK